MTDFIRFLGGALFLGLASLTAFPAPTRALWHASLAATEFGYWIAFAALLPLIPTGKGSILGKVGAILSFLAIGLMLMPVARAMQMSGDLPGVFDRKFGAERRVRNDYAEEAGHEPLVLAHLFKPVQSRAIRFEERTFASTDGYKLTLDVYRPGYEHGPVPGVLVIHGGTWQTGDNSEGIALNAYLAARDHVVISINYRLAPQWPFPAARDDVLSAIAYVKTYAEELGVDASRLALLGRSAGGQLALLAAYTAGDPGIRGVVSLYGPTDMKFAYEHPAPVRLRDTRALLESYLGGAPTAAEDAYFAASPINFVSEKSPATLLIHGARDGVVLAEESKRLEDKLLQAGVKHLFLQLPWATHECDRSFGGPCGQIATYAVERFLDGVMVPPPSPPPTKKARGKRAEPAPRPKRALTSATSDPPDVR
jgi:acetyl esterase/lipase